MTSTNSLPVANYKSQKSFLTSFSPYTRPFKIIYQILWSPRNKCLPSQHLLSAPSWFKPNVLSQTIGMLPVSISSQLTPTEPLTQMSLIPLPSFPHPLLFQVPSLLSSTTATVFFPFLFYQLQWVSTHMQAVVPCPAPMSASHPITS